jgi:hypothetical protein
MDVYFLAKSKEENQLLKFLLAADGPPHVRLDRVQLEEQEHGSGIWTCGE